MVSSIIRSTIGNALRFLYANCFQPTTSDDHPQSTVGVSALADDHPQSTVGVSALAHDLFNFQNTSQVTYFVTQKHLQFCFSPQTYQNSTLFTNPTIL
jgi:hypothetical protein